MTFNAEEEKSLLALIEEGVSASADALAAVSRTTWSTQTVSIKSDSTKAHGTVQARLAADPAEQYGAFLSMPGAVFVFMVPKKSGPDLAAAFLGERRLLPGAAVPPEGTCIAEIANIVVNTIGNTMANACDDAFILSAPTMVLGRKEGLLKIALDDMKSAGETYAIMTYVSMSSKTLSSDCTVVLLLAPACRGRILKALGQ
jgi:hypothetical protein